MPVYSIPAGQERLCWEPAAPPVLRRSEVRGRLWGDSGAGGTSRFLPLTEPLSTFLHLPYMEGMKPGLQRRELVKRGPNALAAGHKLLQLCTLHSYHCKTSKQTTFPVLRSEIRHKDILMIFVLGNFDR